MPAMDQMDDCVKQTVQIKPSRFA